MSAEEHIHYAPESPAIDNRAVLLCALGALILLAGAIFGLHESTSAACRSKMCRPRRPFRSRASSPAKPKPRSAGASSPRSRNASKPGAGRTISTPWCRYRSNAPCSSWCKKAPLRLRPAVAAAGEAADENRRPAATFDRSAGALRRDADAEQAAASPRPQLAAISAAPPPNAALPLQLSFRDENGRPITLAGAIGGVPAVVIFADFTCHTLCGPILEFAAAGLGEADCDPASTTG